MFKADLSTFDHHVVFPASWLIDYQSPFYGKPDLIKLLFVIAAHARHFDKEYNFKGAIKVIRRGELVIGLKTLSGVSNTPRTTLRRRLNELENLDTLTVKKWISNGHQTNIIKLNNFNKLFIDSKKLGQLMDTHTGTVCGPEHERSECGGGGHPEVSRANEHSEFGFNNHKEVSRCNEHMNYTGGHPTGIHAVSHKHTESNSKPNEQKKAGLAGQLEFIDDMKHEESPIAPHKPITEKNELRMWSVGIWSRCGIEYLKNKLNPAGYPDNDLGKTIKITSKLIEKWGQGNYRLGAQYLVKAVLMASDKYAEASNKNWAGKKNDWMPTLDNLFQDKKLRELLSEVTPEFLAYDCDIEIDPQEFMDANWYAFKDFKEDPKAILSTVSSPEITFEIVPETQHELNKRLNAILNRDRF